MPNKQLLLDMLTLLEESIEDLPQVERGRFFGLNVLTVQGEMFAMVWKNGRIGLRFRDTALNDQVLELEGSEHWVTGGRAMRQWILMVDDFVDDSDKMNYYLESAYQDACAHASG